MSDWPFSSETLESLLSAAGVAQPAAAASRLMALAERHASQEIFPACCQRFAAALADTPVPESSLANFMRLLETTERPVEWAAYLVEHPRALEILVKLFVGSQHLTDTLVREPELLRELTQQRRLADIKSRDDFLLDARQSVAEAADSFQRLQQLRRYQRRELLRIAAADTFSLLDLRSVTGQLSLLAEALIQVCLEVTATSRGLDPSVLTVLAMGKLGGGELNYSSDIDLILLAEDSAPEWIELAQQLVKALGDGTADGFLYRVDLRLRPWGSVGLLTTSPGAYLGYLERQAAAWERQALLKARVVAGDLARGEAFLRAARSQIFRHESVETLRAGVRQAKQRIEKEASRAGHAWGDVKSGRGSLRDIEFVVQFLQLHYGTAIPAVRTPNTLDALVRLADFDCVASSEYRQLTDGYVFLRTIEHALQLMHNQQRHALPADELELSYLARRLDYPDARVLMAQYVRHVTAIRTIYRRYLEQQVENLWLTPVPGPETGGVGVPVYEASFSAEEQIAHRELLRQTHAGRPVRMTACPQQDAWTITVVGDDRPGDLSMTCGLLFVHGIDILNGIVTTMPVSGARSPDKPSRSAFVNRFTVRLVAPDGAADRWNVYESDLNALFVLARTHDLGVAQGALAKRVATTLREFGAAPRKLSPMQIEFDNRASDSGTLLRLKADDSIGFLYELTNALALCEIDIKSMSIHTNSSRVEDTLLVTDARRGGKITSERRLRELEAAIVLIKQFTHLLPHAPNPEAALLHFRSLIAELFQRPRWMEELASLERPEVLEALSRMLGVSDFLWEDMLRLQHANLFPVLKDLAGLEATKSRADFEANLAWELAKGADQAERIERLNAFKDREMFRIDMRHILGKIAAFHQFSEELSDLAEVIVAAACQMWWTELTARFGFPRTTSGEVCRYIIAALGKCGGRELGFASDIELLFVYDQEGATDGRESISNMDFFTQLVERFAAGIQARQEGIFQIDLRLRPYGRQGQLAICRAAFEQYFDPRGPAWPFERQALVKWRPIAGNRDLGTELTAARDRMIYTGQPVDPLAMQALRERQVRQLVQADTFHAKLSPGALVEIEYFIQLLQLRHGHLSAELRTPATAAAARALRHSGHLSDSDYRILDAAYWFLRRLIDALRMVRGNAQDLTVPPRDSEEFEFLARRLGSGHESSRLRHDIELHQQNVMAVLRRHQLDPTV